MKKYDPSFNPFSDENHPSLMTALIVLSVLGIIYVLAILFDKFIIPRLSPDNIIVKKWRKHIIDINPFEK